MEVIENTSKTLALTLKLNALLAIFYKLPSYLESDLFYTHLLHTL